MTQEALCCGLPAFVTKTAGIAERFEGELADALLIPDPNDAPGLAARLRSWRSRAVSAQAALETFSKRLRDYTWDHMAARIAAVIAERPTGPEPERTHS